MNKSSLIFLLIGAVGIGGLIYWVMKSKVDNDDAGKKTPASLDPNANINIYGVNPNINTQTAPPTTDPVSAYVSPYRELIDNETISIAQNSTRAAAVQQANNIPTQAYNELQGDQVLTEQTKSIFKQRFNINPNIAAEYPFPSNYLSQSFGRDMDKIAAEIGTLINTVAIDATKPQRLSTFAKKMKGNPKAFLVEFWQLDFQNLVREAYSNPTNPVGDRGKLVALQNYFKKLKALVPVFDEKIKMQAVADLKRKGYKFIEYP